MSWIIIAGLSLFLILSLWRLEWAVLLLIAALPTYLIRFSILGLPLTFLEGMILISFAVWLATKWLPNIRDILRKRSERQRHPFDIEIIALLLIALGASGIAGFSSGSLGIWKAYFFEPALLFILLFNLFSEKSGAKKIMGALLVSTLAVSGLAIFQKITGLYISNEIWAAAETRRVVSFFGYPNAIGLYLAPLVLLFTGWLFYNLKNKLRINGLNLIIIITILSSLSAIYFARSEGALIGIAAGLVVFGIMAGKTWRRVTIAALVAAIVIIGLVPSWRTTAISKLTLRDLSGEIRRQQWTETMTMLNGSRLITGAGLDNYQKAVAPYHQEGIFFNRDKIDNFHSVLYGSAQLRDKYWQPTEIYLYPHNIFLNFWSEISLFGALLFVWIILKYLYLALKLNIGYQRENKGEQYLALGLLTAMVAIGVHGLVDVPYFKNDLALLFWALVSLVGLLSFNYRRERELKN
jgi:O-antigen ligase